MGFFEKMKETRTRSAKLKSDSEEVVKVIDRISHSALTTFNDFVYRKIEEVYGPFYLLHGAEGEAMVNQLINKKNDPKVLDYWLKFRLMMDFEINEKSKG